MTWKAEEILLKGTMVVWITSKLLTWRLWTTQRLFPTIPIWKFLDSTSAIVHSILFVISILLMLAVFKFYLNKYIISTLIITEIFSCILDINRLQPWEYQFIFVLIIYLTNKSNLLSVIIFSIACIYIYSGLQKLHPAFLQNIWGKLFLNKFFNLESSMIHNKWVIHSGYILALYESFGGLALLFKKTRKFAIYALMIMHLFILLFFGPLILNINFIIWPWNLLMLFYLFIFLNEQKNISFNYAILIYKWNKLITICLAIMPLLGIFGYWDQYLSANLYSGKNIGAVIFIKDTDKTSQLHRFFKKKNENDTSKNQYYINLNAWSLEELHVPLYPEKRVLKAIESKLKIRYGGESFNIRYY